MSAQETNMRETVAKLEKAMLCNCDLDNWQPEESTGHSWVCRIHKAAVLTARATNGGEGG
jgi:hypothetical protein